MNRNNSKPRLKAFTIRINENLFNQIQEDAQKYKRSVVKEIEFELEHYQNNKGE